MVARLRRLPLLLLLLLLAACSRGDRSATLRLATTTSLVDTGLLAQLVAAFEQKSGAKVEVTAAGSGKALELLQSGAADLAITHAPEAESAALAAGRIGARTPLMRNDFVLVGPKDGIEVVGGSASARETMRRIAASGRKFVSRGDQSGTHQRETALWKAAGIAANAPFVVTTGTGMGEALRRASDEKAFTLTDRSTFMTKRGDLDLVIVYQGDEELRNVYSALEPREGSGERARTAHSFVEFLRSPEGRALIGQFGVRDLGEPLFVPQE